MSDWREQYQRIHLDCLSRDIGWLTDKAASISGYARQLSMPPIVADAKEELAAAELSLSDALAAVRQSRAKLQSHVTLEAAE